MILWVLKVTLISFILILVVHSLIGFFRNTLTVPKLKDLVNGPTKKYENMYKTMSDHSMTDHPMSDHPMSDCTPIDVIYDRTEHNNRTNDNHESNNTSMKDELKDYLRKQLSV